MYIYIYIYINTKAPKESKGIYPFRHGDFLVLLFKSVCPLRHDDYFYRSPVKVTVETFQRAWQGADP